MARLTDEELSTMRHEIESRIHETLREATEELWEAGRGWYHVAHELCAEMAEEYGYSIEQTTGVMAIVSPRTQWVQNIACARAVLAGDLAEARRFGIGSFVDKAAAFLRGEANVTGGKVEAFWDNLARPASSTAVTLDTVMANVFGIEYKVIERVGVREMLADLVREVAADYKVRPHEMQAILWVTYRGRAN